MRARPGWAPGRISIIGRQAKGWRRGRRGAWRLMAESLGGLSHQGSCREGGLELLAASVPRVASPGCLGKSLGGPGLAEQPEGGQELRLESRVGGGQQEGRSHRG